MIVLLDNRDSFVLNLARYLRLAGARTEVIRSTGVDADTLLARSDLSGIILSPGPGRPEDAGCCVDLLRAQPDLPVYGVCLGHQCMATAFGGATVRSPQPTHGRSSWCEQVADSPLYSGMPGRFQVGRYHSLTVQVPEVFRTLAQTDAGEVMAMQHRHLPYFGVQYHPESLLSSHGMKEVENFVQLCKDWRP